MRRTAFTLIEMVVSLAIFGVLLTAMGSAMVLVTRAMPRGDSRQERQAAAAAVLDEACSELADALYVAERTEHAITFSTPDRDGDGRPDRIRYAWSGVPGEPLTRSYNGSTPAPVLSQVASLTFLYDTEAVTETYPGATVEAAETLLSGHTAALGSLNDRSIKYADWVAQEITPTFPAGIVSWRVTRVQLEAMADGDKVQTTRVRLSPLRADGTPDTTVRAEAPLPEQNLTTGAAWHQVEFSSPPQFLPADRISLVLASNDTSGPSMRIRYDNGANGPTSYARSDNQGTSWSVQPGESLRHAVYGRFTIRYETQRLTRRYITAVTVSAAVGEADPAHARVATTLLNRPEALDAYWHADFSTDPTRLDANADGQRDWYGQTTISLLSGGLLSIDDALETRPGHDFTTPVTLESRFRSTSSLGGETGVSIQADRRADGACATLSATVTKALLGSQTLRLHHVRASGSRETLFTLGNLPNELVAVRLLIDPTHQTVCLAVNGRYAGSFPYDRHTPSQAERVVKLLGGGGSEFDGVTIRVGGEPG